MMKKSLYALPLALAVASSASANKAPEEILDELAAKTKSTYLTQSPQNRMMMPDNPAYDIAEQGEKLFKEKRGPKNASLERCDFGKGPGVLKGAYVELPRYFADARRVMDFESRLVYCMKTLQGFTDDDPQIKQRHGNTDIMKLTTYIAMQSNGMPWNPPMKHPLERAMRDAGKELFFRRAGPMDFNCATCHTNPSGTRIRASVLPNMKIPEEWTKAISWPAYRVGHHAVRSSQHRVLECLWQMRYPNIRPDSDAMVALISFWTDAARGQPAILPDMKR